MLEPTEEASDEALDQTIEIIRNRVDALGVAEPEIARQGDSIVVQLPGVDKQQRALDLVGATAELRFRPVLLQIPGRLEALETTTTTAGTARPPRPPRGDDDDHGRGGDDHDHAPVEGQGQRGHALPGRRAPPRPRSAATTTTTTAGATTTRRGEPAPRSRSRPGEEDLPEATVVLAELDDDGENVEHTYQLGPSQATGEIVADADAELDPNGQWRSPLEMKGGADGIDQFNAIAAQCSPPSETCPTGQLAIVLDSVVQSAPDDPDTRASRRTTSSISGSFTESEAKDLALALRYGSLPVTLEPQTVQTVSPTLGEDSLKAGLAAGLLGLALVCVYMIFYYRALGIVVVLGLVRVGGAALLDHLATSAWR